MRWWITGQSLAAYRALHTICAPFATSFTAFCGERNLSTVSLTSQLTVGVDRCFSIATSFWQCRLSVSFYHYLPPCHLRLHCPTRSMVSEICRKCVNRLLVSPVTPYSWFAYHWLHFDVFLYATSDASLAHPCRWVVVLSYFFSIFSVCFLRLPKPNPRW